jgi:hypothetical protein
MARVATRYYCVRCDRPLVNDPTVTKNPGDTVTATAGGLRLVHDGCRGVVEFSEREAKAT